MDIKELKVVGNQNHPWEYARSIVVNSIVKRYLTESDRQKLVLDVGCGDVFFLSKFQDACPGNRLVAVDTAFDDEIIGFLNNKYSRYHIEYVKDIDEVKATGSKVSIVFLLDVLEHIENAPDFLKILAEKPFIDKNTLFAITVPACQSLFVEHDKWLGHYRRYSRKTLTETVRHAGLSELTGGYFFFSLFLIRSLQKAVELFVKPKQVTGIGNWKGGKMVSFLYKTILVYDFRVCNLLSKIGIRLPGLSTYSISKPS